MVQVFPLDLLPFIVTSPEKIKLIPRKRLDSSNVSLPSCLLKVYNVFFDYFHDQALSPSHGTRIFLFLPDSSL